MKTKLLSHFDIKTIKLFLFMLTPLILIQCDEDPEPFPRTDIVTQSAPTTTATRLLPGTPKSAFYQLSMTLGHDASECTGCVVINGTPTHVPCRGPGNKCNVNTAVVVTAAETHTSFLPGHPANFYTVTSLHPQAIDSLAILDAFRFDDFFLFPDRSFFVSGNNIDWRLRWMNIPEQYVKRNNDDSLLYYERVTFSSTPLFSNE